MYHSSSLFLSLLPLIIMLLLTVSLTPRPLYPQERSGTHCTEGWVWTGTENPSPTRIRSLDRPVRSQSLYLSHPTLYALTTAKHTTLLREPTMLTSHFASFRRCKNFFPTIANYHAGITASTRTQLTTSTTTTR
jgi:hypothetical protein